MLTKTTTTVNVTVNGTTIKVDKGETLVDAGLYGRIVLPHDCCVGHCETCRVTVVAGAVDDHGTAVGDTVLACMATVTGDCEIMFDPVPLIQRIRGEVLGMTDLSDDVVEVRLRLGRPLSWLSGQYVRLAFDGFPTRDFSPTFAQDRVAEEDMLVFQVRRIRDGVLSPEFGRKIRIGHKVTVRGPFGSAFLRRGEGRIFVVSTGTGWAPMWAVALSARLGQPWRPLTVIAGVRSRDRFYMEPALQWLYDQGASVIRTASDGDGMIVRTERPEALLAGLQPGDTVYAAGSPTTVEAVGAMALAHGVDFHADAFVPSGGQKTLLGRLTALLGVA